jgi:transcriptional regulator with XRE-family HTH domain
VGTRFGEYLKRARLDAKLTQKEAATRVLVHGRKASQGLIAQYESGKIADPDPTILNLLARAYNCDYRRLVLHLIRDKYELADEWSNAGAGSELFKLWEAALTPFPEIAGVEGLEEEQLRAKAALIKEAEILDLEGIAQWQKRIDPLDEYWVVTPKFVDNYNDSIFDALIYNIRRGVHFYYFVLKSDRAPEGKFALLKKSLQRKVPDLRDLFEKQIHGVSIDEKGEKWINADMAIANPRSPQPIGFAGIRRSGLPIYGVRMEQKDVENVVDRLSPYVDEAPGKDGHLGKRALAAGV